MTRGSEPHDSGAPADPPRLLDAPGELSESSRQALEQELRQRAPAGMSGQVWTALTLRLPLAPDAAAPGTPSSAPLDAPPRGVPSGPPPGAGAAGGAGGAIASGGGGLGGLGALGFAKMMGLGLAGGLAVALTAGTLASRQNVRSQLDSSMQLEPPAAAGRSGTLPDARRSSEHPAASTAPDPGAGLLAPHAAPAATRANAATPDGPGPQHLATPPAGLASPRDGRPARDDSGGVGGRGESPPGAGAGLSAHVAAPSATLRLPDPSTGEANEAHRGEALQAAREESQAVNQARLALRSGDAVQALSLLAGAERRFGTSLLAQEREALTIEALATLGRLPEARSRAQTFLARYPTSPHAGHLREVLGRAR